MPHTPSGAAPSIDQLLLDPVFLVHADPADVLPLLSQATSAPARLAATVYRTSFERHRRVDTMRRRQALSLDAARWGADELARRFAAVPIAAEAAAHGASTVWDTGDTPNGWLIRRFEGRTEEVASVATAILDGRPVAVGGSFLHDTVRVWDVASGQEIREPLVDDATAVATATLHGRPILVTGDVEGNLRRWDLTTGKRIGDVMSGHAGVTVITTTVLDGRPIAVSCGYPPDAVRVWDLDHGTPIGEPLDGHTGKVGGVAVAEVDGRIVVITASDIDRSVRIWDLAEGRQLGEPLECYSGAVATAVRNGRPVAVTGGGPGNALLIWDLIDRRPIGDPLPGHRLRPSAIATTTAVDGRPIAISGGYDNTVRLWDLVEGRQIGAALAGHTEAVTSVAFAELDDGPVAVTASRDNTLLLWDASLAGTAAPAHSEPGASMPRWQVDWATGSGLSSRVAMSLPGRTCRTLAAGSLDGRPIVVSGGWNQQVRILDPIIAEQIGASLSGHAGAVTAAAVTTVDTRTVAVTGGDDRTVRIWDLAAGAQVGEPLSGHTREIRALAVTELDGRPVALSAGGSRRGDGCEVRIWDLAACREFGEALTGHTAEVRSIAFADLAGRQVALSAGGSFPDKDCTVRVWDLTTRQQLGAPLVGHTREVLAVSATLVEGMPVAVTIAADTTARVWDLTTRTEIRQLRLGRHQPRVLAATQLGGRAVAVTAGSPQRPVGITDSTVRIWDLATGEEIGEPLGGHQDGVPAMVVTELHGSPVAVTGGDDSISVWDLDSDAAPTLRPRAGGPGAFESVAVAELDGREVAITGTSGLAQVWDLAGGGQVGEPIRIDGRSDLAVTELDGQPVLVGAPRGEIVAWSLADGSEQARHPTDHNAEITAVGVGEEQGRPVVVTGTHDNAVAVHDLETGKCIGRHMGSLHNERVLAAAITEDDEGRPVAVTVGGDAVAELIVWQLRNGTVVSRPRIGHTDDVMAVAVVTRDGRATAVTAGRDKAVRVWQLADGELVLPPLRGHSGVVNAVAAAVLDGRPTAVSGGEDRTVRVWDLGGGPTGDELVFPYPVTALALTPKGRLVVCFGTDVAVLSRHVAE